MNDVLSGLDPKTASAAVTLVIVAGVMAFRFRKPQALKIERLWVRPVIFIVIVAGALSTLPPPLNPINLAPLIAAAPVGALLGWQRGRLMKIEVHPETHDVTSRASPLALIFVLALMGIRLFMRDAVSAPDLAPGLSSAGMTDALIVFAGAIMSAQNLEMWLRARRLLAEAQAAKAAKAARSELNGRDEIPASAPPGLGAA